jgi:hypothetical protein
MTAYQAATELHGERRNPARNAQKNSEKISAAKKAGPEGAARGEGNIDAGR